MVTLNIRIIIVPEKVCSFNFRPLIQKPLYTHYTVIMAEVMLYEAYVGGVTNILVNFEGLVNKKP